MKTQSSFPFTVGFLLTLALAVSPQIAGQTAKRAGEVSRLIPTVGIERSGQQLVAEARTSVL